MSMLTPLLRTDPASPRLTVYDEARGTRMEFSAQTLDNWANKVANMLDEEFELPPSAGAICIDLPASWQSAVIALGAYNSSRVPHIGPWDGGAPEVVFVGVDDELAIEASVALVEPGASLKPVSFGIFALGALIVTRFIALRHRRASK